MATAYQGNMEKCAKCNVKNIPVSRKVSYELCNAIRGKDVKKVIAYLERVSLMKQAVPYKRFNRDTPHRPGKISSGRYPVKAAQNFLVAIKSAVANAKDKGLNEDSLKLVHICSNFGSAQWRHGRQGRKKMKSIHLEVVVEEVNPLPRTAKKVEKPSVDKKESTDKKTEEKKEVEKPIKEKPEVKEVEKSSVDKKESTDKKTEEKKSEDKND